MTWSIVACDRTTGQLGVAVATKFFAVGAIVPFIASKVGAIATQALVNPYYGIDGLQLLRDGHSPADVLRMLRDGDIGQAHRQAQIVDASGNVAAYTGRCCIPWSCHAIGDGFSVAGNTVAGRPVVDESFACYSESETLPLARRLIAAMLAGEAAGGDKRGKQSAALIIMGDNEWPALSLRVDDHQSPLSELDRLERISQQEWLRYRQFVPTRSNPSGITDHSLIDAAVGPSMSEV